MNTLLSRILIAGISCCAVLAPGWTALAWVAGGAEQGALNADHSLMDALGKSGKAEAGKLLDADFVWTDADGKSMKKAEVLSDLEAYAKDNQGDAGVETHFYGQVETVLGTHHDVRFLRVWVKRPAGWREFLELDTVLAPPNATATVQMSEGRGDCENPCRAVPYTPTTAMDKAILADWQKTKMEEWHPDAADWPMHIADEFLIINNRSIRNKPQRVAIAQKQQEAGVGAPGDPITAMEIHDFGDNAAVMISHHVPYRGGKPYYNVRVWTLRDGRWQLAISQQSIIQSATPVPPVSAK
jgi:hypothetical protein